MLLKKYPLNKAIDITGVKFGGCGISLEKAKNKMTPIGYKILFIILLYYLFMPEPRSLRVFS